MNLQQTSISISSDDDNELMQNKKFVQQKSDICKHSKRVISKIVLDLKKLQQSGLDRKIAAALGRQRAAATAAKKPTTTITTTSSSSSSSSSSSFKNDDAGRSNQSLNETMNDYGPISNVISSNSRTTTTPSIETIAGTSAASNKTSLNAKFYLNASKNLRNIIPPTITITKAMDSPPERMADAPSSSSSSLSAIVNQTSLDLMSSKDRLEHAKKLLKRNILIKRGNINFKPDSPPAGNNQLSVPKAVIVRSIMKSRDVTNTKPTPVILNFTNQMKSTYNMKSSPINDNNRNMEYQSQTRNPVDCSSSEAYCDFKRPFPRKTPTVQQMREPATKTTSSSSSTFSPIEKQKVKINVDNQLPEPPGSNLIVLENKVLTPDEKIDLNDLRLNSQLKGKGVSLSKAHMKLNFNGDTRSTPTKVVAQPKKMILSADKLKRTPAELAALAKQIQSSISSSNKGSSSGGGIQKSLLKLKVLKNVGKTMELKSPSQISLKDNVSAATTTSKVTSNQVMKSNDSLHYHNTLLGSHFIIDNPSHDKQNTSPVSSNKYKSQSELDFQSIAVHDCVNDVNVQSQLLYNEQNIETITEENPIEENFNSNFENYNNNGYNKQISDKRISESITQEPITESNHLEVTDKIIVASPSTNINTKHSSNAEVEMKVNVDQNKTDEIETTITGSVSKPILSAVDFIAALAAAKSINETAEMELSPEEIKLNATFSLKLSTNHLMDSLTDEERQLMQSSSSSAVDDVSDISIGQILPLNNVNILDSTVDKTDDSNILHIVSVQETEDQKASVDTEVVTTDQRTTITANDNLNDLSCLKPETQLPISTEICIPNSNKPEETSKVNVTEKIPENVAPQRKPAGRFKKGKINLVQRSKPSAKKPISTEKLQLTEIDDLSQETSDQIRTEVEILEPSPPASNKSLEETNELTQEENLYREKMSKQNTESNQIEKISSYDLNVVLRSTKITENDASSKEEEISKLNENVIEEKQQILDEESLEPTLQKDPEEVIIGSPNTSLLAAINYVEHDHGPPQVPFKYKNISTEQENEMKVERPVGINNLLKIIEDNKIQQTTGSAVELESSKSDEIKVKSESSSKEVGRSLPRKKLIKAKPVLKTKRKTKNKDETQNSNKLPSKEVMEKEDKDQVPLEDITTIDKNNENVSLIENRNDAQKELNKLDELKEKFLHLSPKCNQSDQEKKDDEHSVQCNEIVASNAIDNHSSSTNQSNQSDPDREDIVESPHSEASEEDCAMGLEYNVPTIRFKRRRLETEQESELEIENTTKLAKYSCDDETAKEESSQDEHCILADRKRLRKTYHNKTTKTVEPLSDSDDERFFGFDEQETTWNPRRPPAKDKRDPTATSTTKSPPHQIMDIPSCSTSSGMPLKKRWELLKNPSIEMEVTDDTSPIDDEIIEEIQPKDKNEHMDETQIKETNPSNNVQVKVDADPTFVEPIEASTPISLKITNCYDKSNEDFTNENEDLKKLNCQSKISSKELEHSEEISKEILPAVTKIQSQEFDKSPENEPQPAKRMRREQSPETSAIMDHEENVAENGYIENKRDDTTNIVNKQSTEEVILLENIMPPQPKKLSRKPKHENTQSSAILINDDTIMGNLSKLAKDSQRVATPKSATTESVCKPKQAKTQSSTTEIIDDSIKDNMPIIAEEPQKVASPLPVPKKRGRKPKGKTLCPAMEINDDSIMGNLTILAEESQRAASPIPQPKKHVRKRKAKMQCSAKEIIDDSIMGKISIIAEGLQKEQSLIPEKTESYCEPEQANPQSSATEINDDLIKDSMSIIAEEPQSVESSIPEPKKRGRKSKAKTQCSAMEINDDLIADNVPLSEWSRIVEKPKPEQKRRGRKPKHTKAETESTASDVCVDTKREIIEMPQSVENITTPPQKESGHKSMQKTGKINGGEAATFDPRLLLICKRDQLKSNEELTVPNDGTGPLQCGLCLGRTNKNGWIEHVSKHYGIGWLVGETPLNVSSRAVILSTATNFIRNSGIKDLACRMCQRLYRSGLGILMHIEMCGEAQQRLNCSYCKKSYTKLSLQVHERQCAQRMALATKQKQESENESNAEEFNEADKMFSNTGRVKRMSTLKAESKLKDIGKALTEQETEDFPNFDPKKYIKYESAYNLNKLQKKWEQEMKNFSSTFCPKKMCTFSTSDLSLMLKHLDECKHVAKPGYYCTACKKDATNFISEAIALKHVMETHKPLVADFDTDGSDYDIKCDKDNSSNNDDDVDVDDDEDFSSGVDSNEDEPVTENSEEDDEAGSGKWRIKRQRSKIINIVQKQLFPGRQRGLDKIMSHKWQKFLKDNYTKDMLYDFALPMYKILDKIEALKYLPVQETSMKFSYERTQNIQKNFGMKLEAEREWTQLRRFESMHQKNEHFTFIGGAIRHLAWIPLPGNSKEQYLAINYFKPQQFTRHFNPKSTPSIILIMKFEESRNSDSGNWQLNSSVHYGIRIPEGAVHSFAFLPSGGYNKKANRLGLMAVGCTSQNIKIYPLPLKLSEDLETDSSFIVIDLTAALVLTLELQPQNIENKLCNELQCMQICWSESQGHNLLVGGFSNGCIGFWDIEENEAENLNRFMIEEMRYFVPLNYMYFGEKNIRYLALHYGEDGARWVAVGGSTRRYAIFSIRNLSAPQKISADMNAYVTSCIDWPPIWECVAIGWCNILVKSGGRVKCLNPIGVGYIHSTIDLMLNTPRSIHYNSELLIQALGNDNGDVIVLNPREFHLESTIQKSQTNQRAVSMLDLQCLSGDETTSVRQKELEKPTMHNEDFKQRYGIIYKSLVKVPMSKKSIYLHENRHPPHNLMPYLRVNCVRFNGNASAQCWLAAGCENGLLRIFNFKRNSYFHMS